jgi:iron complex outermembrane recepter protein
MHLTAASKRRRTARPGSVVIAALLLAALRAYAQRAEDNAVTAAADAFGTTVGNQTIGLYTPNNARGFSPAQAENLRIEGLYFDQQTNYSNQYLFSGSDMRVGIAAQTYAFPSPTGIADYRLRVPGAAPLISTVLIRGPIDAFSLEIDTQYPVIPDKFSLGVNVATVKNFDVNFARSGWARAVALLMRLQPTPSIELIPFFGYTYNGEHQELATVYADGVHPMPLYSEQKMAAQDWSSWGWKQITAGVVARWISGESWRITAGLFRSVDQDAQNFNDLMLGLMPNGIADHVMDVPPPRTASSYSGDFRVARRFTQGAHHRELMIAARGRDVERHFGGDSTTDFGATSIYAPTLLPEPPLLFSPLSVDSVRQTGIGLSYRELWDNVGTLSLGALKTNYSRTIATPGQPSIPEHTSAVLPTFALTIDAGRRVALYGSYTRGLEDSAVAPTSALNRGEPPPATPTWQVDGGIRVLPGTNIQLLLGAFTIHKSYFNLDTTDIYQQLGTIVSRGVEGSASLNGSNGLTVVAGFVLLRPQLDLKVPELGGSGSVPVGPVPRTINVNMDYAPTRWHGWAATVQWTALSARAETNNDLYQLPALNVLNVGVRYIRTFHAGKFLARLDVSNATDATGLTISSQYQVIPQLNRTYTLTLALDL